MEEIPWVKITHNLLRNRFDYRLGGAGKKKTDQIQELYGETGHV